MTKTTYLVTVEHPEDEYPILYVSEGARIVSVHLAASPQEPGDDH